MNKFVKGAKNLALGLSFVSVCACSSKGKDELNGINKKIEDLGNRLSEVEKNLPEQNVGGKKKVDKAASENFVKNLVDNDCVKKGDFSTLSGEVVKKEYFQNMIDKDPFKFVGMFGKMDGVSNKEFVGGEIEFLKFENGGKVVYKISKGQDIWFSNGETAAVLKDEEIKCIENCALLGCSVKGLDKGFFEDGGKNKTVKFNGAEFDLSEGDQTKTLKCLVSLIGGDSKFDSLKLSNIKVKLDASGLFGNDGKSLNNNLDGVFYLFNSIKKGCVKKVLNKKDGSIEKIVFVRDQGWTSDGNTAIDSNFETVAVG